MAKTWSISPSQFVRFLQEDMSTPPSVIRWSWSPYHTTPLSKPCARKGRLASGGSRRHMAPACGWRRCRGSALCNRGHCRQDGASSGSEWARISLCTDQRLLFTGSLVWSHIMNCVTLLPCSRPCCSFCKIEWFYKWMAFTVALLISGGFHQVHVSIFIMLITNCS